MAAPFFCTQNGAPRTEGRHLFAFSTELSIFVIKVYNPSFQGLKESCTKAKKLFSILSILSIAFLLANCELIPTPDPSIFNDTPIASDFAIAGTGTFTFDGGPKIVTVTAKDGKTSGEITVRYNRNTEAPAAAGSYAVTFDVAAAKGWNAASGLRAGTLTINPPATLTYTISASALEPFGSLQAPYDPPTAQTVTVTNLGTGGVTLNQPTAADYEIGPLSKTSLGPGETAAFTVQPRAGLAVGPHDETIAISGSGGAGASVSAEFTVTAAILTYTISASALEPFGSMQAPYDQPPAQTVTVTSTGIGTVVLAQPTAVDYEIGPLTKTDLDPGETATFTVRPKANLSAGPHNETISISGSGGAGASVSAEFTVTAAVLTYTISASTLTPFGSLQIPYSPPAAQTVTVTNLGTGAVTLNQPTAVSYSIGTLSRTSLASGEKATFTVQPRAGLGAGTYNETITISGSGGVGASVSASFTVRPDASENRDKIKKTLQLSTIKSPTNIVFLGDGFNWDDNEDGGSFDSKVAELSNYIFSIKPFSTYRDYFSIYSVTAVSSSRGAKKDPKDSAPNTVFNSTFNYSGIDRLLVAQNTTAVSQYARVATPNPHLIVVIVNDTKYGGSGGSIAVTSVNDSAKEIVIHELGHIFSLADEYVDEQYRQVAGITLAQVKDRPNVDTTNDLAKIKWSHFVGLPNYSDSAWEGGYYFATGVWRPTNYSIMRSYSIMEFNAISRETIVKKILATAGETYSLPDFLARDTPPVLLRMPAAPPLSGSDNPMPVPLELYVDSVFGDEMIRAPFGGEE